MQSLDSIEMLKDVKRLTPFSTGQFYQTERSQATFSNQNIPTNVISMHCGLLIINGYISISEILSELKFYLDSTIIIIQNSDLSLFL